METNYRITMYLLDYNIIPEEMIEDQVLEGEILEIKIVGSLNKKNGQDYREEYIIKLHTIIENFFCIGARFTCNCKDFSYRCVRNDSICKHITFILCKIAGIFDDDYFRTKILAAYHTEYIFKMVKSERTWRNSAISIKYLNDYFKPRKEIELNDFCNICYDDFDLTKDDNKIVACPECCNIVHEKCMKKWLSVNKSCVYCRSEEWVNYDMDIY